MYFSSPRTMHEHSNSCTFRKKRRTCSYRVRFQNFAPNRCTSKNVHVHVHCTENLCTCTFVPTAALIIIGNRAVFINMFHKGPFENQMGEDSVFTHPPTQENFRQKISGRLLGRRFINDQVGSELI